MTTWRILKDPDKYRDGPINIQCVCGIDADLATHGQPGALLIAAIGMRLVFEPSTHIPPPDWLPSEIQCRHCQRIFGSGNVR